MPGLPPRISWDIWGSCWLACCLETWATAQPCSARLWFTTRPGLRGSKGLVSKGGVSPQGWGRLGSSPRSTASYFSPSPKPRAETEDVAINRLHLIPRSPEQSKASAGGGPDNCIEPVSPPDGVGEPEHAKSATYPILYREGEQMDQR